MPQHIGIVGCSAEGAALCYRTLCAEGTALLGRPHAHPEVTLHTPSLADYVDCLDRNDLQGVADLMLASARKLARAGADFLICPDNTIHQAMDRVLPHSPLPWLYKYIRQLLRREQSLSFRRHLAEGVANSWLMALALGEIEGLHQPHSRYVESAAERQVREQTDIEQDVPAWRRTLQKSSDTGRFLMSQLM
jgi:hypothetical protein